MVLDPSVLGAMAHELGADAADVINGFLSDFPGEVRRQMRLIEEAAQSQAQAQAVHRLRGSALNLGAVDLVRITTEAERRAVSGQMLDTDELRMLRNAVDAAVLGIRRQWPEGWRP
jgi:HPt (histidine-containing phosphotransfer) domain-containing protein